MAISRDRIVRDAHNPEQQDRAELGTLLINSLDPTVEQGVEEAWMQEIDRRVADLDSGAAQTIPWDVVRARLRGKPLDQKYIVDTKCYGNSLRISQAWKRDEDFDAKWLAIILRTRLRPPGRRYCGSIRP